MIKSRTMAYFGKGLVDRAISDYFARHGLTEEVRDELKILAASDEEAFFDIVDNFVMRTEKSSSV